MLIWNPESAEVEEVFEHPATEHFYKEPGQTHYMDGEGVSQPTGQDCKKKCEDWGELYDHTAAQICACIKFCKGQCSSNPGCYDGCE